MVASSSMPFETAEDFGPDMTHQHINVKETAAFWKLLDTFLPLHSQEVRHKKLICHTDSQVLYFAFKKRFHCKLEHNELPEKNILFAAQI